jgi:selenide,water dikinase
MLEASGVSARLNVADVRLYEGFRQVVDQGIVSTLHRDNAKVACRVEGNAPAWLFDPQTAGGLLAGVEAGVAGDVVRELIAAGYADTTILGEVMGGRMKEPPLIRLEG